MIKATEIHIYDSTIDTKNDPKYIKEALKQDISEIQLQCKR